MDPFVRVAAALLRANVAHVVTGVWGANYYSRGTLFATQDQDLFLPPDPQNLRRAWHACESLGLRLLAAGEPLDQPRDDTLAAAVVQRRALTTATDGDLLHVDLSLVMTGFTFEEVATRARSFEVQGTPIRVASLADIVAAKAAAGRPKDRLFLASHAEELRRLLRGD